MFLMPYRKGYKKPFRKFKRRVGRYIKKRVQAYSKAGKTLARCISNLTANDSAGGPLSFSIPIDFPAYINFSGTPVLMSSLPLQLTRYMNLYDEYRVKYVRARLNLNTSSTEVGTAISPTGNLLYPYMSIGYDYDDYNVPLSINQMGATVKYKRYNMLQARTLSRVMSHKNLLTKRNWLNTGSWPPNTIPVTSATITQQIPTRGSIKCFLENAINGITVVSIAAEWMIEFRGERTTGGQEAFIANDENVVVVVTDPPVQTAIGTVALT